MEQEFIDLLTEWSKDEDVQNLIDLDIISEITLELLNHKCMIPAQQETILHKFKQENSKNVAIQLMCRCLFAKKTDAFYKFISVIKNFNNNNQDLYNKFISLDKKGSIDQKLITNLEIPTTNVRYEVTSKPLRGLILIMNQTFHLDAKHKRHGCEKDVKRLISTFENLKYGVVVYEDSTSSEMLTIIKDFFHNKCHKDLDAAGIIIMTHGSHNDIIMCSDKSTTSIPKILEMIQCDNKNDSSPPLAGKPIFIVINACRGGNKIESNIGFQSYLSSLLQQQQLSTTTSHSETVQTEDVMEVLEEHENKIHVKIEEDEEANNKHQEDEQTTKLKPFLPKDCFLMYSTMPTCVSYRHPQFGSVFIQAMCEVVETHGKMHSWKELVQLISEKDTVYQGEYKVGGLVPVTETTLTKAFYLDTCWSNEED